MLNYLNFFFIICDYVFCIAVFPEICIYLVKSPYNVNTIDFCFAVFSSSFCLKYSITIESALATAMLGFLLHFPLLNVGFIKPGKKKEANRLQNPIYFFKLPQQFSKITADHQNHKFSGWE